MSVAIGVESIQTDVRSIGGSAVGCEWLLKVAAAKAAKQLPSVDDAVEEEMEGTAAIREGEEVSDRAICLRRGLRWVSVGGMVMILDEWVREDKGNEGGSSRDITSECIAVGTERIGRDEVGAVKCSRDSIDVGGLAV